jgi:RsiW-degrading membrane proteinase PrsW (M82 family)
MLSETNVLILSLLGGIVPALFWLWFWMKEDNIRPEPKSDSLSAFIAGIIAVLLALFFELIIYYLLAEANSNSLKDFPRLLAIPLQSFADKYDLLNIQNIFWNQMQIFFNNDNIKKIFLVVIIAPIIEELLKLLLTYNICLRRKINDEPIDASIYMLTTALGFAAIETALILTEPLSHGKVLDGFIAGNFRSVGPMLIHLVSSATIGIFMGLAFYKSGIKKFLYLIAGFLLAVILHATFNFFIVMNDTTHNTAFFWTACLGTWALVAALLISFEKVKKVIHPLFISAKKVYVPRSF